MQLVSTDEADPYADAAVAAIRCGDVAALGHVLTEAPALARVPVPGCQGRTLLHWAASSEDGGVARALLDGGAAADAPDGSIGTPLDNAIGYGCWHVAELLAARGARIDKLWHAAALGRLDRLETLLASGPDQDQISQAFWHACAASRRRAAERLLDAGADLAWIPDYAEGTPLDAVGERSTSQQNIIEWLQERGATSAKSAG